MAIQKEVWVRDIQEQLFAGKSEFLRMSTSHDEFVEDKTVHVPQAGTIPGATKNRAIVPAVIKKRTDTDLSYNLDDYTTDPIYIDDIDEIQTSYAKRESVLKQHVNVLKDRLALETLHDWSTDSTAANQIRTTGVAVNTNLPPGAAGTRNKLTVADLASVAKVLDEANVPDDGRVLILPPAMYYEIFTINDLIKSDIAGKLTLPEGVAGRILGFDVIKRNGTVIYDDTGTPILKAVGAASAGDDNFGGLAWHPEFVSFAKGAIKMFDNIDDPTLYGSVYSALVLAAGKKLRSDEAGIVNLIQA